jgi:hypothetical protein
VSLEAESLRWLVASRAALQAEEARLNARLREAELAAAVDPNAAENLALAVHLCGEWPKLARDRLRTLEHGRLLRARYTTLRDALARGDLEPAEREDIAMCLARAEADLRALIAS